jgi:hypothetical protein
MFMDGWWWEGRVGKAQRILSHIDFGWSRVRYAREIILDSASLDG